MQGRRTQTVEYVCTFVCLLQFTYLQSILGFLIPSNIIRCRRVCRIEEVDVGAVVAHGECVCGAVRKNVRGELCKYDCKRLHFGYRKRIEIAATVP